MSLPTLHVITRLTLGGSAENTVASMVALAAGYPGWLAVGVAESDAASVDDARRRGVSLLDVPTLGREVGARDVPALVHPWRAIRARPAAILHTHPSKAVPSGVPTAELRARAPARATARARLGLPADAFVVAGLGRFVPVKGFDLLVAALPPLVAAVPSARLVLVGDGPERRALEAQAVALGVRGRLLVTGAMPDIAVGLAAADALAAPSRNEGMGRALG